MYKIKMTNGLCAVITTTNIPIIFLFNFPAFLVLFIDLKWSIAIIPLII